MLTRTTRKTQAWQRVTRRAAAMAAVVFSRKSLAALSARTARGVTFAAVVLCTAIGLLHIARGQNAEIQRSAGPEAELHIARMIWSTDGGGAGFGFGFGRPWWAIDYPEAEYHFRQGVRRLTRIDIADDSRHLRILDDALFDYPWLFAQQVGRWSLSDAEARRLREYLFRGGFLVVDDFHGPYQWEIFAEAMRRVFPDRPIQDLAEDEEILHVLYDLDERTQIPGRRHLRMGSDGQVHVRPEGSPPTWRGIYDDEGRLMVVINFNMDMGDAWEHADDPVYPEPMTALAYRFGINYIMYAMTH